MSNQQSTQSQAQSQSERKEPKLSICTDTKKIYRACTVKLAGLLFEDEEEYRQNKKIWDLL